MRVLFGRQAETTSQYLKKGSSLLVEGRLQTRSWDGTDGQKRYRTEIVADRIQFGQRSGGSTGGSSTPSESGSKTSSKAGGDESKDIPADTIDYPEEEINPDDIPF
jgi:single-strand DNA-binding protein